VSTGGASGAPLFVESGKPAVRGESTRKIFSGSTPPPQSESPVVSVAAPAVVPVENDEPTMEGLQVPPLAQRDSTELLAPPASPRRDSAVPQTVSVIPASKSALTYSQAMALLETAKERDEIIDIFYRFAHQAFEFSMLAVVTGDTASGRLAGFRGEEPVDAAAVSIPLNQGGLFQACVTSQREQIGAMEDTTGMDVLNQLGRDVPLNAAAIPVILKKRVILLFYGDSAHRGVRANRVEKLMAFSSAVSAAFERILMARKYASFAASEKSGTASVPPDAERAIRVDATVMERKKKRDFSAWTQLATEPVPMPEPAVPPAPEPVPEPVVELIPEPAPEPVLELIPEPVPEPVVELIPEPAPPSVVELIDEPPPASPPGAADPHASATREDTTLRFGVESSRKAQVPLMPVTAAAPVLLRPAPASAPPPSEEKKSEVTVRPAPRPETAGVYMHVEKREERMHRRTSTPPPEAQSTNRYPAVDDLSRKPSRPPAPIPLNRPVSSAANPVEATSVPPQPAPIPLQQRADGQSSGREQADLEALVLELLNGRVDDGIVRRILDGGEAAIAQLIAHFPGPLLCDRFQEMTRLPAVSYHGPVLRTLSLFEQRAVPYVLPLLESFDSEIRFYATFLFSEIGTAEVLPALVNRLFDNDRQIRAVAIDIMREYTGRREYRQAIAEVAMVLAGDSTPLEKRRLAAEILGELRDTAAIAPLASMLGSVDGVLAERCQRALVRITFNDFGFSERKWMSWFAESRDHHRIEWAIEALTHKNENIRRMAMGELRQIPGDEVEWPPPPYDFNLRKEIQRRCVEWWNARGRSAYPVS